MISGKACKNAYIAEGGSYATTKNAQMANDSIKTNNTGGNLAHNNMQPFTTVNYIIATTGTFPSRS